MRHRQDRQGSGPRAESPESAADRGLRLLAQRPYYRAELQRRLARLGHGEGPIAAALARLAELGYLDDGALTSTEVARLAGRKGFGPARIRAELARRGAPQEALDAALAGYRGDEELAAVRDAAARWQRRGGGEAAALARHLARRGFGRRAIFSVLAELGEDAAELGEDES